MSTVEVGLLRGDGIGPEVTDAATAVINAAGAKIDWVLLEAGGDAYRRCGAVVPQETGDELRRIGVALKAPYTTPTSGYESPSWALREAIDAYVNVRSVHYYPFPRSRYRGLRLTLVRDQTEDLSRGASQRSSDDSVGIGLKVITRQASERVAEFAMEWARSHGDNRVTIGHIATSQRATDGLFLEAGMSVARGFPDVSVDEEILDGLATHLIQDPTSYRVLLTESVYGGIFCGIMAGLAGTVGVMPGAFIGPKGAVFEAGHGSAPKYAGTGRANPVGMILSGAMLLDHIGQLPAGDRVRAAVAATIEEGQALTRDMGGTATTAEFSARCCALLA